MKTLIVSCSLHPSSRSRVLAEFLCNKNKDAEFIDLKEYPLPLCDGASSFGNDNVAKLKKIFEEASGVIITAPVYNYNLNSSLKNLIELLGDSWSNKTVAFACAAGGKSSYLAPLTVMNNLMVDFRCFMVPRYVYATASDFNEERTEIISDSVKERLMRLNKDFLAVTKALMDVKLS